MFHPICKNSGRQLHDADIYCRIKEKGRGDFFICGQKLLAHSLNLQFFYTLCTHGQKQTKHFLPAHRKKIFSE